MLFTTNLIRQLTNVGDTIYVNSLFKNKQEWICYTVTSHQYIIIGLYAENASWFA